MSAESDLRTTVFAALRLIAPEVDPATLDARAPLREEIDLDSLDELRLVGELEQRCGITIPDADRAALASLDDLVGYLERRVA